MEGKDGEESVVDVPLAAHESVSKGGWQRKASAAECDHAGGVCAAKEDDHVGGRMGGHSVWKGRSRGSGFNAWGMFGMMGSEESGVASVQLGSVAVVSAVPDLGLPKGIEALDLVLESLFAWWGKDGDDAEAKAVMDQAAKMRRMTVRALENGVVVELCVSGQAPSPPAAGEAAAGCREVFAWSDQLSGCAMAP